MNSDEFNDLRVIAGRQAARQRTGTVAASYSMIYTRNRFLIWALRPEKRRSTPFKIGVDYAMADAFPLIEGNFPDRIAQAIEALVASEGGVGGLTT